MRIAEEERKLTHLQKPREGICQICGNFDDDLVMIKGQNICGVCRETA